MRGKLTEEISLKSIELFGYEINQIELRLMAYIQYVMMNEQKIDIAKINQEERQILKHWKEKGFVEGGASGLSITKDFWDALNQILWLGYVIGGSK